MNRSSVVFAVAAVAAMSFSSAQAAPIVVYSPITFTGGTSFETRISTNCLKTGTDAKAVSAGVLACYMAGLNKDAKRGTTFTNGANSSLSGNTHLYSYVITWTENYNGKPIRTGKSGQNITGSCPGGYSFTADGGKCQKVESADECVTRVMRPSKAAYDDGIQWCKNLYNNDVGKMNIQMRTWRQEGSASLIVLGAVTTAVFTTVGAVSTPIGIVTANAVNGILIGTDAVLAVKLSNHWSAYMNATEAAWNNKLLNQENQCFATFEKTYLAKKAAAYKECGK